MLDADPKNLYKDYGAAKPSQGDQLPKAQPASRLEELEAIIAPRTEHFIKVGEALAEIRDKRLYKERYGTFAEYCELRWGFKASYGYRLIEASEAALALPAAERPKSEGAMRKVLGISKNVSASGHKIPKRKSVTIEAEFVPVTQDEHLAEGVFGKGRAVPVSGPEPENERAERWGRVYLKLRGAKDEEGFLEAIEKLIEDWGL